MKKARTFFPKMAVFSLRATEGPVGGSTTGPPLPHAESLDKLQALCFINQNLLNLDAAGPPAVRV